MLTSPITVNLAGTAHSLSRINNDNFGSVYLKKWTLNELRLTIRHSYQGKAGPLQAERHNVELVHTVFDGNGGFLQYTAYSVGIAPRVGAAVTGSNLSAALADFLDTNAVALQAWES